MQSRVSKKVIRQMSDGAVRGILFYCNFKSVNNKKVVVILVYLKEFKLILVMIYNTKKA
jgi:hypothetical protein